MSALRQDPSIAPQELYPNSVTTGGTDLGARFTTGDGRVFRYALGSGTAIVQGRVYQASPQQSTQWQSLGVNPASGTGTFTVTTGSSVTLAANALAGGVLTVRASSGSGFAYGIKSHPAAASGTVTFTLSDPLQVALTTSSVVDATPNLYSNVVVAPTVLTGVPLGVAATNAAANSYFWLQTRGLGAALSDGAITVGRPVTPSVAVGGAVQAVNATTGSQTQVGYAAITTTDATYAPFFLAFE